MEESHSPAEVLGSVGGPFPVCLMLVGWASNSLWTKTELCLSKAVIGGRSSPLLASCTLAPGTSPHLSAEHLHLLSGQVQAPQV